MSRLMASVVVLVASASLADSDLGASLPDNARPVGEHRYKSVNDWEGTLKFYKKIYAPGSWRQVINQPGVRAIHIPNTSGKGDWLGLNVYEANEEVRIYVVPNDSASGKEKRSKSKKDK
jgi:hypothetical protein